MLEVIQHDAVAEIRLARPPVNALNLELLRTLHGALDDAVAGGARGIVLSGAPGMFSAGVDVPALLKLDRAGVRAFWREFFDMGCTLARSPVPLVAAVLLQAGEPLSELELKARAFRLMTELAAAGDHVYIPRRDQDYAIVAGLRMLTLRHLVEEKDGLYVARPEEMHVVRYYANSISHLLGPHLPGPPG